MNRKSSRKSFSKKSRKSKRYGGDGWFASLTGKMSSLNPFKSSCPDKTAQGQPQSYQPPNQGQEYQEQPQEGQDPSQPPEGSYGGRRRRRTRRRSYRRR
jgi:hypothetical protein